MGRPDTRALPIALTALRQATADLHRAVEQQVPLMSKDFDRNQYVAWLQLMHPFYSGIDEILSVGQQLDPIPWAYVPRAALIEQDLAWLNARPQDQGQPLPTSWKGLSTAHHRLGILYVVEGSALGGQVLHKALARTVGVTAENGASFLMPHGPDPRPQWAGFIECLRPFEAEPDAVSNMITGAQMTFSALSDWIRRGWQPAALRVTAYRLRTQQTAS
jgi:heme oxygenase (biliverdin-IX-beta and delta-forming)